MKRLFAPILAVFLALAGSESAPAADAKPSPAKNPETKTLVVGTGGVTGFYFPAGGALCRLVNAARIDGGLRCLVESTPGSIHNLSALRKGELDLAVVQSGWLHQAATGQGLFAEKGADKNLKALFSLHGEPLTILVRKDSGLKSAADLKGKKINLGRRNSVQRRVVETLVEALGWKLSDFGAALEIEPEDQVKALCDKRLDAAFYLVAHPIALIAEAEAACDATMIEVGAKTVKTLLAKNPAYAAMNVPGGMYPGNPNPIETFGVKAVVAAGASVDEATAYALTKALFDNLDSIKKMHPTFDGLEAEAMAGEAIVAPLHDGARRYFKEAGLAK